jgi:integrase
LRVQPIRPTERTLPTWEQVRAASESATTDTGLAIAFLAMTGLRASELCGLEVRDLHMLRRELRVERQLLRQNGELVDGPPKTPESRRTVPMPAPLVDLAAPVLGGRVHVLGAPAAGDSLAHRVSAAAAKAGASFAPHALRHLYTNTLLEAGIPLRTVDYLTGHRSAGMTVGVYAHVTPESVARASATIASAWSLDSSLSSAPGALEAR